MAGFHIDRISEDIKREIISLMRELKDPRVAGKMLTVVNVTVSNDLSYAKVYISAMSGIEEAKTACKGLAAALTFVADDSIEKGMEIFEKLKDASNEN